MLSRMRKTSIGLGIVLGLVCLAGFFTPGGPSLRLAAAAALCPLFLVPFVLPRRNGRAQDAPRTQKKNHPEPASSTPRAMGGNYA